MPAHARKTSLEIGHRIKGSDRCDSYHGHSYELSIASDTGYRKAAEIEAFFDALLEYLCLNIDGMMIVEKGDPIIEFFEKHQPVFKALVLDEPPTTRAIAEIVFERVRLLAAFACIPHSSIRLSGPKETVILP